MNAALRGLLARARICGDGAYGTALRVEQDGSPPELLNLTHPDRVCALAQAYIHAGADVLHTNTFATAFPPLNVDNRCRDIVREGVAIAVDAAAGRVPVLAVFGPPDRDILDMSNHYTPLVDAALEAGANGIVLETMTSVEKAALACLGLSRATVDVLVSYTPVRVDGQLRTHDGKDIVFAARRAVDAGACAVGFNCSDGPATVLEAVAQLHDAIDVPIIARPNAGVSSSIPPEAFAKWSAQLYAAGAWMVGGCCGTAPAHVAAIARARQAD